MSEFEVKVLGGKVIPAIASTNAMAAAMQSLESYKVILIFGAIGIRQKLLKFETNMDK